MEEIYEVQLIDKSYKIKVACSNMIDKILINTSWFISNTSDGKRIASLVAMGDITASIWEAGEDGIYRNKMDINITLENKIQITKMMPNGEERRTDIDIVI